MRVLVVNTGSSSLKLSLLAPDDSVLWSGGDLADLSDLPEDIDAVGHRVVHGGASLQHATVIDDEVIKQIEALTPLAPLHQPRAVEAIRKVSELLPDVPAVACFDTAFHSTLSPAASTYALPRDWLRRWDLRRFGFHGLSHQYASRRAAEVAGRPPSGLRLVTCHLGAGASVCAVRDGRSVDTSMGFTPLEGLVMATRSGTVDPGLILWLINEAGLPAREVADALERLSGLAGLSGGSGDFRELMGTMTSGENAAKLAFEVYIHRLRREIAAMAAALGGLDVLVFTGGVGEHVPIVRATAARQLGFLGVAIDGTRNNATTSDGDVSADGAAARTVVVTAREDIEIARQVRRVLR
ncbi:MAG: acetate/propionate family kinase [Acidimicrobiales bacterium]